MTTEARKSTLSSYDKAYVLSHALPYMQSYADATVVVKYGGHAMGDEHLMHDFARDMVLLKHTGVNVVVVHGGGPQIGAMLERLNIKSEFSDGLRITDEHTIEIVEMVLAGAINKQIVAAINAVGGRGVGLSGKDGGMMQVRKLTRSLVDPDSNIERLVDLGFVGEPSHVDRKVLDVMIHSQLIPVIAPVATGEDGRTYNVNADTFAAAIAGALSARRLLLLTDVPGVLDRNGQLIKEMNRDQVNAAIAEGVVGGGMLPKLDACTKALDLGAEGVVIVNGQVAHSVLLELFTDHGQGTIIR